MFGTNIQSPADPLRKVQESYLYHSLANPKPGLLSAIQQLRIVYSIDASRYAQLKRRLPYIVCGMFNPPYRRTENFAYTESFILDLDHLSAKKIDMKALRAKIIADSRVTMCFASPSKDGLKVMFRLKNRCYDSGLYKIFYKAFATAFAQGLNIDQVIDASTCDVARACFVSVDADAYYNDTAASVDLDALKHTAAPVTHNDHKKTPAQARRPVFGLRPEEETRARGKTAQAKPGS